MNRSFATSIAFVSLLAGVAAAPAPGGFAGKPQIISGAVDFPPDPENSGRDVVRITQSIRGAITASVVVTGGTVIRDKDSSHCGRIRYGRPSPRLRLEREGKTTWRVSSRNRRVARAVSAEVQRFEVVAGNRAGSATRAFVRNTLCSG